MDYLETQATLDTGHRTKRNKKFKHETENKKDDQYEPHNKTGGEPKCSRRESSMI